MGMPADLGMITKDMMGAAMDMVKAVMPGARDTTIALFHDLDRQKGMAGDDDAGHEFAKVYQSAASTTLDKMGFSALVMSETGRGLMHTAREFMAGESHVASQILGQQVDMTDSMGDRTRTARRASSGVARSFKGSSGTPHGSTSTRQEAGAAGSGARPRSCVMSRSRGAGAGS